MTRGTYACPSLVTYVEQSEKASVLMETFKAPPALLFRTYPTSTLVVSFWFSGIVFVLFFGILFNSITELLGAIWKHLLNRYQSNHSFHRYLLSTTLPKTHTGVFLETAMRAMVTGGAGFIGSHLIDRLVARGDTVVAFDNLSSGHLEFIQSHLDSGAVTHVHGDITDFDAVLSAMEGIDCVFHLAANPDIRLGTRITDTDLKQGTLATYNIVESMRRCDVKKIVFASSSVVYGEDAPLPTPEDHGPCMPISLYGASKQAGEGLISSWVGTFGLQAWIFRFANIIGTRGTHGVIFDFIHKLKSDPTRLEVLGNGRQEKSYMEVEDCVDGILHVMKHTDEPLNLFNLGSHDTASVRRIAEIVVEETGCHDASIEYTGGDRGWAGDIPRAMLGIYKMLSSGFDVRYNSEDAIRHTARALIEEIGMPGR